MMMITSMMTQGTSGGHLVNESATDAQYVEGVKAREREASEANLANIKRRVPSRKPIAPPMSEQQELPPPPPPRREFGTYAEYM